MQDAANCFQIWMQAPSLPAGSPNTARPQSWWHVHYSVMSDAWDAPWTVVCHELSSMGFLRGGGNTWHRLPSLSRGSSSREVEFHATSWQADFFYHSNQFESHLKALVQTYWQCPVNKISDELYLELLLSCTRPLIGITTKQLNFDVLSLNSLAFTCSKNISYLLPTTYSWNTIFQRNWQESLTVLV